MGFTPYYAPTSANYREYVERRLSTAMTPGIQYSVSFWLTNGTAATHNDGIANLGVYFSTSSITQSGDGPIILTPQLERAGVFYSTSWQQVTFSYTPSQAYNFITIGNFRNDASTTVGFFGGSRGVYYFIDDIVVQAVISLPVELTEFTAEENSGVNILHWETASEQNSRYFVIERSDDGVHFDSIGVIEAAGNSNSVNLYNFTDSLPFVGINYYRLKQYDADGRFEYSNIVHVKNGTELFSIQTGASGKSLTIRTTGNLRLDLYSVTGANVYSCGSLNGYQEVNLSNLSDGIYFARATDGERTVSKKILLW
jgi:hypothetical protein